MKNILEQNQITFTPEKCKQIALARLDLIHQWLEFRTTFSKEINVAFESYRKTQLNKYSYKFKDDNSMEFNFYFSLQWNFNHFGMSNWYIERM